MSSHPRLSLDTTIARSQDQASADLGSEVAILNLQDGVYYGLNAVGARIWELLEDPRTVRDVRDALLGEYDVTIERCERDLLALLEQLAEKGLVNVINAR